MMLKIKIAPSILAADKTRLNEEIAKIEQFADLIHIDVMDGKFVESTAITAEETKQIKVSLPMEAHLMVNNPEHNWIDDFVDAGCSTIIIHEEAPVTILNAIQKIKSRGAKVGISLKPATPLSRLRPYLKYADMVLIMSVNPGYSGQKFIPKILSKISELRKSHPHLDIEVDGGINLETAKLSAKAGANIFVAASYIFGAKDSIKAIQDLRNAVEIV